MRVVPRYWFQVANRYLSVTNSLRNIEKKEHPLMAFFDVKENWGANTILAGRPWRIDELRLKSNSDLHKLWYILLKERNMLMTMEEEHNRQIEKMPNSERLEKVEESMENILLAVQERNNSINLLEKGENPGPTIVTKLDKFGREITTLSSEHDAPKDYEAEYNEFNEFMGSDNIELLRLEREKIIIQKRNKLREERYMSKKDSDYDKIKL